MSEHFLEEQLKRIREMSEQMSRVSNRAAELSEAFERERASARHGPLQDVRDLRSHSSNSPAPRRADDHGAGHSSRPTSRSRRK
jgi:hypothetical protein